MNETTSTDVTPETPAAGAARPQKASVLTVVKDQRKTIFLALGLAIASFWIVGQLGEWQLAGALAVGVGLGLFNHLATEYWLLRIITTDGNPSRASLIRSTIGRLTVLVVVAVALCVLMWPGGIGVLIGLAIFRLLALAMTSMTLLKELKSE